MSDSDSILSGSGQELASDAQIACALRNVVTKAFKGDNLANLTLKGVRAVVTDQLGLPEGFLKTDSKWKEKSKAIVKEAVETTGPNTSEAAPSSPHTASPKAAPAKSATQKPAVKAIASPKQPKRKSTGSASSPQTKRRKKTLPDSDSDSDGSTPASNISIDSAPDEAASDEASPAKPTPKNENVVQPISKDSVKEDELGPESELSDVLDDSPAPKSKRRKPQLADKSSKSSKGAPSNTSKARAKSKTKTKQQPASAPQDEEVKRLQGHLVKCGVRKLWGKELARFDTPKEKIAHLKGMLKDVGMGGRFSEDKARQIKEERELKAELEAIQDGDEMWGKKEEVPRRRLARGLQELQGLGDDEESD